MVAPARRVVLYLRPACPLCEPVIEALATLGIVHETVDITGDERLEAGYGISIPVVEVDGEVVFDGGMDAADLPELMGAVLPK